MAKSYKFTTGKNYTYLDLLAKTIRSTGDIFPFRRSRQVIKQLQEQSFINRYRTRRGTIRYKALKAFALPTVAIAVPVLKPSIPLPPAPPEKYYRNMVVRNYTVKDTEKDKVSYPFNVEVRATVITKEPLSNTNNLGITTKNLVSFFLKSVRHAEKKGKVVMTEGKEENVEVSKGEVTSPIGSVEKYVRVDNEQSFRTGSAFVYDEQKINRYLAGNQKVMVDTDGYVWIRALKK